MLRKTDWLPIQNTSYLKQESDNMLADVLDYTKQVRKWIKRYDQELTDANPKRDKIGMAKKELYKQVKPNINKKLSEGILRILNVRDLRQKKDFKNASNRRIEAIAIEEGKKPGDSKYSSLFNQNKQEPKPPVKPEPKSPVKEGKSNAMYSNTFKEIKEESYMRDTP